MRVQNIRLEPKPAFGIVFSINFLALCGKLRATLEISDDVHWLKNDGFQTRVRKNF